MQEKYKSFLVNEHGWLKNYPLDKRRSTTHGFINSSTTCKEKLAYTRPKGYT